jgi:hypothetical protein
MILLFVYRAIDAAMCRFCSYLPVIVYLLKQFKPDDTAVNGLLKGKNMLRVPNLAIPSRLPSASESPSFAMQK